MPIADLRDQPLPDDAELTSPDDELHDEAEQQHQADEADRIRRSLVEQLGLKLKGEFDRRKTSRNQIELRWHEDLRQYNAVYEQKFLDDLTERKYGSKVFVPLTRRICNLVEARLGDLLFPTDDRNFVVESSPVPELADAERLAKQLPHDHPVDVGGEVIPANAVALGIRDLREEAQKRAAGMQRAIDDQLKESNYGSEARKVINDAIKLGTGVLKGPAVLGRTKKKWTKVNGITTLELIEDVSPAAKRVPPWNFYPDMSTGDIEECDGFYELHRLSKAKLAKLARQAGFDRDSIERVISSGNEQQRDPNLDQRREASGTVGVEDKRYNLVEYTGSVDCEELAAWGIQLDDDPLAVYSAVVWFSEATGIVVKCILSPMDTDDAPYAVFNWQPDDACLFGYGLPYELRDMQESGNAAFRAMLDNMGLSVGPQLVVNSKKVRPVNGQAVVEPNKVWDLTDASVPVQNVFGFFQVESRITELMTIFNASKQAAEEIGGPMLAMKGEEATNAAQGGATGWMLAYSASSVWMRRAVKLWDDQVSIPMIGRFIDWNMQYSDDESIKGDLHAIARGTSALLEAEGQVSRVQLLAQLSAQAGIPIRKMINQLRAMARAMRLDPEDLLPDDNEVKQMEEAAKKNGPPPNPELERIALRRDEMAEKEKDRGFQLQVEERRTQIRLAEIASRENLTMEQARQKYGIEELKVQANLQDRREQREHDAQALNAEIAVKATAGSGI